MGTRQQTPVPTKIALAGPAPPSRLGAAATAWAAAGGTTALGVGTTTGLALGRRALFQSAALSACAAVLQVWAAQPVQAAVSLFYPSIPAEVQQYWNAAVASIQQQIGESFEVQLIAYAPGVALPSGAPGDPAMDFGSSGQRGDGHCGPFQPASPQPYACCPPPGQAAASPAANDCCRHFAYCLPPSRLALAPLDRTPAVVVSPRLFALPAASWQAILAHELGHAVDFWAFGGRYGLTSRFVVAKRGMAPELRAEMAAIDGRERDPELRADALGELLVVQPQGFKLCYEPVLKLQQLVPPDQDCGGHGGDGLRFMRHYTHPPLQGSVPK